LFITRPFPVTLQAPEEGHGGFMPLLWSVRW
jgi:hypothetical protein